MEELESTDHYRVEKKSGFFGKREERYLMVTARYFKFWRGSVEDECFELCNVSEVKTSSSGDRLRVTMDSLYGKETIEIFFEDKFKAESFREILALNQDKDAASRETAHAEMQALHEKFMSLSPSERALVQRVNEPTTKVKRRVNKRGHMKKMSSLSEIVEKFGSLSDLHAAAGEGGSGTKPGRLKRTHSRNKSSIATVLSTYSSIGGAVDDTSFPDLKTKERKTQRMEQTDQTFEVMLHKVKWDTKHRMSDVIVILTLEGSEGSRKSNAFETPLIRFADVDDENEWAEGMCTFNQWGGIPECGDRLKVSFVQYFAKKGHKQCVELASTLVNLGFDVNNFCCTDLWLDLRTKRGAHVAWVQTKIKLATAKENPGMSNAVFGVPIGGRKESKLMAKNKMLIVTLKGGVNMSEKNVIRMWLADSKDKSKSDVVKSLVYDPSTQFGLGNDSVFKYWGGKYEYGDKLYFALIRRQRIGKAGKEKGKKVLIANVDFKSGYSTSLWLEFPHTTHNVSYDAKVCVNIKFVRGN